MPKIHPPVHDPAGCDVRAGGPVTARASSRARGSGARSPSRASPRSRPPATARFPYGWSVCQAFRDASPHPVPSCALVPGALEARPKPLGRDSGLRPEKGPAGRRNRTADRRITNALLYLLSYPGASDPVGDPGRGTPSVHTAILMPVPIPRTSPVSPYVLTASLQVVPHAGLPGQEVASRGWPFQERDSREGGRRVDTSSRMRRERCTRISRCGWNPARSSRTRRSKAPARAS